MYPLHLKKQICTNSTKSRACRCAFFLNDVQNLKNQWRLHSFVPFLRHKRDFDVQIDVQNFEPCADWCADLWFIFDWGVCRMGDRVMLAPRWCPMCLCWPPTSSRTPPWEQIGSDYTGIIERLTQSFWWKAWGLFLDTHTRLFWAFSWWCSRWRWLSFWAQPMTLLRSSPSRGKSFPVEGEN